MEVCWRYRCILLSIILVLFSTQTGLTAEARYSLITGNPSEPHASEPLQHELLLGRETMRNSGSEQLPFYNDPDTLSVRHQLLRTHVPVTIISHGTQKPATGILLYRFRYPSTRVVARYTRETRRKTGDVFEEYGPYSLEKSTSNVWHSTEWRWNVVPLNTQKKIECILTPQEFVSCEKEVWDASQYIIKSSRGDYRVYSSSKILRQLNDNLELEEDDQEFTVANMVGNISTYAFPFLCTYRYTRAGIGGKWPESEFPVKMKRYVDGNELWQSCRCEAVLFTPDGVVFSESMLQGSKEQFIWDLLRSEPDIDHDWIQSPARIEVKETKELQDIVIAMADYCVHNPVSPRGREIAQAHVSIQEEETSDTLKGIARQLLKCGNPSKQLFTLYLKTLTTSDERIAVLQGWVKNKPQTACLYECLAKELLKQKEWRRAVTIINRWRQLEPDNNNMHLAMYHAATGMKREREADQALGKVLEEVLRRQLPHLPLTTSVCAAPKYLLGQLYEKAGKYDKALAVYRASIQRQETNYVAQLGMARVYMASSNPEGVNQYCQQVLKAYPNHPEALRLLVLSAGFKSKEEEALEAYETLIKSISGVLEERARNGDWRSVWSLAEYALQDMTQIILPETLLYAFRMKVQALIQLEFYEEASTELHAFGKKEGIRPALSDLWALLYASFNEDPHAVVISKTPLDWNERARAVLHASAGSANEQPTIHLMTALQALKCTDEQAACTALMNLYEQTPSEWLACWIGDLCLQIEEQHPGQPIDHKEYKKYLEAAIDFYCKAGKDEKKSQRTLESPMTYIGLSRAYRHNEQEGLARYTLNKCRGIFPGFPEIWREELEDTFKLESPCTKTNKTLLAGYLHYRPNDCALFELLNKKLVVRSDVQMKIDNLNRWSRAERDWMHLLQPEKNAAETERHFDVDEAMIEHKAYNRAEVRKPTRLFTIRLHPHYEAEMIEHTTIIPQNSIPWYAVRSRYVHKDLRRGNTRLWRDIAIGNSAMYHGIYAQELNDTRRKTSSLQLDSLMRRFEWKPDSPERYYWFERKHCFYDRVKIPRRIMVTKPGSVERYTQFPELHFGIPHDRRILPKQLRSYFVPPEVMDVLWKESESSTITFGDMLNWERSRVCPFWIMPQDGSLLTWKPPRGDSIGTTGNVFAGNGIVRSGTIYRCEAVGKTNESQAGFAEVITITPLPFSSSWTAWPDEGIRIEWKHTSPTSAYLQVNIKSYQQERGIENDGSVSRSWKISDSSQLEWELDGKEIRIMVSGDDAGYTLTHKLSPFAWKNGLYTVQQTINQEKPEN